MKKLLLISLCLFNIGILPASNASRALTPVDITALSTLIIAAACGTIGYEIGQSYGNSIGRKLDDLELLKKLKAYKAYEEKYGIEALEKKIKEDRETKNEFDFIFLKAQYY